jgi:hypothetical protein
MEGMEMSTFRLKHLLNNGMLLTAAFYIAWGDTARELFLGA